MTSIKENKPKNLLLASVASLFIPGLGQLLSKKMWRGITIFAITLFCAYITGWSYSHLNIGKIQIGTFSTSWLWLPLILFWLWNIFDSY